MQVAVSLKWVWMHVVGWVGWLRMWCHRPVPPIPHPTTQWSAVHRLLCPNYALISLWLCRSSAHWPAGTARENNNMVIQDIPLSLSLFLCLPIPFSLTFTATVYWNSMFLCLFFFWEESELAGFLLWPIGKTNQLTLKYSLKSKWVSNICKQVTFQIKVFFVQNVR